MNILLTNDDGIDAQGLNCLYNALKPYHNVYVIAPKENKSGTSQSINMYKKLLFEQRSENIFAIDGTPCDCIIAYYTGDFINNKIDLVLSGINRGPNLGTDVLYSGTCGAARQASLYGIKSFALSVEGNYGMQNEKDELNYEGLCNFIINNLDRLISMCPDDCFLNINSPSADKFKGVKYCSLCKRKYHDTTETVEISGEKYIQFVGESSVETSGSNDNDGKCVNDGYISISCLKVEPECSNSNLLNPKEFIL